MNNEQATTIAADIIRLYRQHGGEEYAGEAITQLEHMAQAAQLAQELGYDEEVILAAFLHDIGHICVSMQGSNEMDGYGIVDHEEIGATFLRHKGFSARLIRLVESHVDAKRYLTYSSPGYYDNLSEASKRTLEFQGGQMNATEAAAFEADPLFELMIKLRRWDEAAKIENIPVPDLSPWQEMIRRHLLAQ
ncbi:MAG: HDIG domain-containing protein [Chitinophagaceae bacterium]|nr:HDIG domain-containing protein [Chitinophagaceae bacterium]